METDSHPHLKPWIWNALKIVVACTSLYFVFRIVRPKEIAAAFQAADHSFVLAALALLPLNLFLRGWKWHTLVRTVEKQSGFHSSFGSYLFGAALASVTPGDLGEYLGRVSTIQTERRLHITGLVLLDRLQNLTIISVLGLSGLAWMVLSHFNAVFISILAFALGMILFFRLGMIARFAVHIPFLNRNWVGEILAALSSLTRSEIVVALLLTLSFYVIVTVQAFLLFRAFIAVGYETVFIGYSSLLFVKMLLPISLADLGIREMSAVYLFGRLGVPAVIAVNVSLLIFVINIVLPALAGVFYMPRLRALFRNRNGA